MNTFDWILCGIAAVVGIVWLIAYLFVHGEHR
jgi:uncharacterized membrane protein